MGVHPDRATSEREEGCWGLLKARDSEGEGRSGASREGREGGSCRPPPPPGGGGGGGEERMLSVIIQREMEARRGLPRGRRAGGGGR